MNIEIFGGLNEIGGNKIFINIGDKKFLFDFGLSFSENQKYFSEFLNPRKLNGIIDYHIWTTTNSYVFSNKTHQSI